MSHFPKPFFRKPRGRWYVQLNGKQVNLGPDKDEAFRKYHELMSTRDEPLAADAALAIVEKFLEWCQTHRPDSYGAQSLTIVVAGVPAGSGTTRSGICWS